MGLKVLNCIVDHLKTGTVPKDKEVQELCSMVAMYFSAFAIYSRETRREVMIHVMDTENRYGIMIANVHPVWITLVMQKVVAYRDAIIGDFKGVSVENMTDTLEIYAAYRDVLEHTCSWCKQVFTSDFNRYRCEYSHVSRKNLEDRSVLPLGRLAYYWDTLDETKRRTIASSATQRLNGIPSGSNFPRSVCNLIKLAAGKVDMTASDLMVALDEASESTFLYRPARPCKPMMMIHRGDYVAAIASDIIKALAQSHSDAMVSALLSEEPEKKYEKTVSEKKKKKKKQRVRVKKECPKMHTVIEKPIEKKFLDDEECDAVLLLEQQIQQQIKIEESYSHDAHISRLEKLIFASPAIASIGSWADFD